MELILPGDVELRYTSLVWVDYEAGGQFSDTMNGWLRGDALRGDLRLTNLAPRPDNVNLPTPRGLLTTEDGVAIYVEMNGIATLRPADDARVFVTSLTFRTGGSRYVWLNTVFGVLEGVLDTVATGGPARDAPIAATRPSPAPGPARSRTRSACGTLSPLHTLPHHCHLCYLPLHPLRRRSRRHPLKPLRG